MGLKRRYQGGFLFLAALSVSWAVPGTAATATGIQRVYVEAPGMPGDKQENVSGSTGGNVPTATLVDSIDASDPGIAGTNMAVVGKNAMTSYVVTSDDASFAANVDDSIGLGGGKITMLKGTESGQQLCLVIEDGKGSLVVVDGGIQSNASFLGKYICSHGRKVDAWLLTHPHVDHAGALAVLLEKQRDSTIYTEYANFDIYSIYHSFAPLEFYQQQENPYRMPFIEQIYQDLAAFDQNRIHYNSTPGTEFSVGDIHVRILNQPFLTSVDSGNNTSIVYKISINGKSLLVLGDLPYEAAENLLATLPREELAADIVQMAHHGQHGGSYAFYEAVHPRYALWPTHRALWEEVGEAFDPAQESYTIALTKYWMDQIGVEKNYVMADGNWILK